MVSLCSFYHTPRGHPMTHATTILFRRTMRHVLQLLVLLLAATPALYATDAVVSRVVLGYEFGDDTDTTGYAGLPVSLGFNVRNNNVLPAERYTLGVSITPTNSSTPAFTTTFTEADTLMPFTTREYHKPALWTPTTAGEYRFTFYVDYEFDIDRSNDTISGLFTVYPGRSAIRWFLNRTVQEQYAPTPDHVVDAWGVAHPLPLAPGSVISFADTRIPPITLEGRTWVGFLDTNRSSFFNHSAMLFLVDAHDTMQTGVRSVNSWPLVNGEPILSDPFDSSMYFFGGSVIAYSGDTSSIAFPVATTTASATDSTCAILVSGVGQDNPDQAGLNNNMRRMRRELTTDSLGPRLPADRVQLLLNPTADSLGAVLEGLANKYTKLYFFFSGHGDTTGYGVLRNGARLYYASLLESLFMSGARDICIVVESCYSGTVINEARVLLADNEEYRNLNITILTSSDSTKTSKKITTPVTGGFVTYGEYTLALTRCMGNPDANTDGVPGVSLAEAHAWVRRVNPTLQSGGRIDSVMNPLIWVHRSQNAGQAGNISFPDADLNITPQQGMSSQTTIAVTMDPSPFAVSPTDTTVFSVSPGRQWHIGVTFDTPFSFDAQFKLNAVYDNLSTEGVPGMAYRTGNDAWSAHYPTVWDSTNRTLTALNVIKPVAAWGIAGIRQQSSTSVGEQAFPSALYAIENAWPNPFASATTIRFVCKQAGVLRLSVVNALGATVYVLASGHYTPGVYYAVFNGEALESGMYYSRLEAGGAVVTRPLVLTK